MKLERLSGELMAAIHAHSGPDSPGARPFDIISKLEVPGLETGCLAPSLAGHRPPAAPRPPPPMFDGRVAGSSPGGAGCAEAPRSSGGSSSADGCGPSNGSAAAGGADGGSSSAHRQGVERGGSDDDSSDMDDPRIVGNGEGMLAGGLLLECSGGCAASDEWLLLPQWSRYCLQS